MKYIYLIQSISHPDQRYIGLTSNLKNRLTKHNEGGSPHTSKYKPWKLITFVKFEDDDKAAAFEQYLKSGSGRAFATGICGKITRSCFLRCERGFAL